jgi:hypothetical protein
VLVSGGFREVEAFELLLVREGMPSLLHVSRILQELEGALLRRQQHTILLESLPGVLRVIEVLLGCVAVDQNII